jgi:hypothetical protein
MFQTKVVEKMKTNILQSINSFENLATYKIIWKNMLGPDRSQLTIRCMRIACWIPMATDTHSEDVIIIVFSTPSMVARMPFSVTLYVHYLVCCKVILRNGCPFDKSSITETKQDGGMYTRILYLIHRTPEICVLRDVWRVVKASCLKCCSTWSRDEALSSRSCY